MKRVISIAMIVFAISVLAACGGENSNESSEELLSLDVEFIVPESVEAGETVELKAEVTYGDEAETDASVEFEVWETGDEENSDKLEAENHGDGTYTAEYTFDQDGVFEMYAHTDAQNLHTMPKKEIVVGEGADEE